MEATARAVAAQERVLREHQAAERARLKAEATIATEARRAAEREAAESVRIARATAAHAAAVAGRSRSRARAVRRTRALTSLGLLLSLIALVAGVVTGTLGSTWTLAVGGVGGSAAALFAALVAGQGRSARAAHPSSLPPNRRRRAVRARGVRGCGPGGHGAAWTPQPLPKPLTLERGPSPPPRWTPSRRQLPCAGRPSSRR